MNQIDIDDAILEKQITLKLTIRQVLQIGVLAHDAKHEQNQCEAVYNAIITKLQTLPPKTLARFEHFTETLFEAIGPEWPDEVEDNL